MSLVMSPYKPLIVINDLIQGLRCLRSLKGTRVIEAINHFEEIIGHQATQLELVIYLRDIEKSDLVRIVSALNTLNLITKIKKGKHVFYSINWTSIDKLQITLKKF